MKLAIIGAALLHLVVGASVDVTCPQPCSCQADEDTLEATCASYEFFKKLMPKQQSKIVLLKINNAALVNVDAKLKFLKNLNSLDLSNNAIANLPTEFPYLPKLRSLNFSHNELHHVEFSLLPKNLETVDLSHNSIAKFPKDWALLHQLKTLNFSDNPIDCDHENLLIYEQLSEAGIHLVENLTCHHPTEFYGRPLSSLNASLIIKETFLHSMLGDEAGSGLEDFNGASMEEEREFIKAEDVTLPQEEEIGEGSGDEGSGFFSVDPRACTFNCSTPRPVGLDDEQNASPLPSLKEQAGIIFKDIFQPDQVETTTTTTTQEPELKEIEPMIVKETDKSDVETFPTNNTVLGEMERASSLGGSNKQPVYIVVGLLVAFAAFLVIYYLNKRRNRNIKQRRRNKPSENGIAEEMKPLGKSAEVKQPIEEIKVQPALNESAPLLNGQNGKVPPVEEPEVEIRNPGDKQELLTPQLERVTIKAGELTDSIPKTPLLVHRQVNSDGEIVTTAVNPN